MPHMLQFIIFQSCIQNTLVLKCIKTHLKGNTIMNRCETCPNNCMGSGGGQEWAQGAMLEPSAVGRPQPSGGEQELALRCFGGDRRTGAGEEGVHSHSHLGRWKLSRRSLWQGWRGCESEVQHQNCGSRSLWGAQVQW